MKTACARGHPYPENKRPGRSDCRICHRDRERERKRAAGAKPMRRVSELDSCPQGHPYPESLRPGKSSCAVCHREAQLRRYRANPEASKAAASQWQRENRERRREYMAEYREKRREWFRKYHREQMRWRSLGKNDDAYLYAEILRDDPCSYCGGPGGVVDHIVPKAGGGPNEWSNLTAACQSCNSSKRTKSLLVFLFEAAA